MDDKEAKKAAAEARKREQEMAAQMEQLKAAKRLLAVKRARTDLLEFAKLMMPHPEDPDDTEISRYNVQPHHQAIAAALEDVSKGKILRLIITVPPRHGKSQLCSKLFPAWFMGQDPYNQLIVASYAAHLAEDFGRAVRDYIKSPAYRQVFPLCELKKGSSSADRLETTEGGIATFMGVGGPGTGRGANLLVCDDPVKSREDADSPTLRDKTWEWFTNVAMTRLMDSMSGVLVVMTRWHEDDIVGRITDPANKHYNEDFAKNWKIIHLHALAKEGDVMGRKPGEPLWPGKYGVDYLMEKKNMDPRMFSALYQGEPTPEDGDFFKAEHIKTYQPHQLPKNLRMYAASDHAVGTKQENDKTCLIPFGVDENDHIWILPDVAWDRFDAEAAVDAMFEIIRNRRPLFWWAEKGHISKAIGPFLNKRMLEEKVYASVVQLTPSKDKKTRAQSIHGRMTMGMVHFPAFAPWFEEAKSELLKFPHGKHDDFVDTLAWCGIGLSSQVSAQAPRPENVIDYKVGSIAWVKEASRREERQRKLSGRGGF